MGKFRVMLNGMALSGFDNLHLAEDFVRQSRATGLMLSLFEDDGTHLRHIDVPEERVWKK